MEIYAAITKWRRDKEDEYKIDHELFIAGEDFKSAKDILEYINYNLSSCEVEVKIWKLSDLSSLNPGSVVTLSSLTSDNFVEGGGNNEHVAFLSDNNIYNLKDSIFISKDKGMMTDWNPDGTPKKAKK